MINGRWEKKIPQDRVHHEATTEATHIIEHTSAVCAKATPAAIGNATEYVE